MKINMNVFCRMADRPMLFGKQNLNQIFQPINSRFSHAVTIGWIQISDVELFGF